MAYEAKIIADSVSESGKRLTTFVVVLPRIILAEWNTHRVFSRNSASSRAIPVVKQLRAILNEPFVPSEFGVNRPGMQAGEALSGKLHDDAINVWLESRDNQIFSALKLMTSPAYAEDAWIHRSEENDDFKAFVLDMCERVEAKDPEIFGREDLLAIHKGLTNRLLEPYMWHTIIVTATEWSNFFALRTSNDAQLEIRTIAQLMEEEYETSVPNLVGDGEWHLPFLQPNEVEWAKTHITEARLAVSARCARVSYLTHDTGEADLTKDLALATRLMQSGHMSPFEHAATPVSVLDFNNPRRSNWSGNFYGWHQFRKMLPNESDFGQVGAS